MWHGTYRSLVCAPRAPITPDVMTMAKALGGGFPYRCDDGAFRSDVSGILATGQHGTTFGGNPLACCGVSQSFLRSNPMIY